MYAFYAPICRLLTRVVVFAVLLAALYVSSAHSTEVNRGRTLRRWQPRPRQTARWCIAAQSARLTCRCGLKASSDGTG